MAITHVANKMLTIIWHMLARNVLYREVDEIERENVAL